jgi:mono/diheme cytochrome c family protein
VFGTGPAQAEYASVEEAGKARFMDTCAVCHGADAKGKGPVANLLTQVPTDLTMLAKNNGGVFPFGTVYDTIDGRDMPGAHGTREMPVWGKDWKVDAPLSFSETWLRGRILELIIYLRSIQQ